MNALQSELDTRFSDSELTYEGAQLLRTDNRIEVRLSATRLIPYATITQIRGYISSLISGCDIALSIAFKDANALVAADFCAASAIFSEALAAIHPEHAPHIRRCEWSFDKSTISLVLPKVIQNAINLNEICAVISGIYCVELPIRLEYNIDTHVELPEVGARIEIMGEKLPAKKSKALPPDVVIGKYIANKDVSPISQIKEDSGSVTICGTIFKTEIVTTKNPKFTIYLMEITDGTGSITMKLMRTAEEVAKIDAAVNALIGEGSNFTVRAKPEYDNFEKETVLRPTDIAKAPRILRNDTSERKRVELHLHTQYSAMDALTHVDEAIKTAARFGHKAIAITDHGVVHAFPEANKLAKKTGVKIVYGVEGYLYPDCILTEQSGRFVVLALTLVTPYREPLLYEIAAARIDNFELKDEFYTTVNPGSAPQGVIKELFRDEDDYKNAKGVRDALADLASFIGSDPVIIHDALMLDEIMKKAERFNISIDVKHVDTKLMTSYLHREEKDFSLDAIVERDISLQSDKMYAMRVLEQTRALYVRICGEIRELGESAIPLMTIFSNTKERGHGHHSFHIIILAKNHGGLINLYKLVSYSHIDHFKSRPRIPRSLLLVHKAGLILGSACEQGEVFRSIVEKKSLDEQQAIAKLYDYLEIQPIANNMFMIKNGSIADEEGLRQLNRDVVALADSLNKPVVATCDAHFLNPQDAEYRTILLHSRNFSDIEQPTPLYFRTTDEMLSEFAYLGDERAMEVVVDAPNAIADMCDTLKPYLDEKFTYAPKFENANEDIERMAMERAHELYGEELPPIVAQRLEKELSSIIGNDYSSLYLMAQKLVQKSLSDGYLVGSRGSVGSSFVAYCAGITEVNSLPPHYICKNCKHSEFPQTQYSTGLDMPDKACPQCGEKYLKAGYDIPFEVFLGFKGDKTPDIDLNFSGEYQPVAHKFTEEMMGEGHAFRSGTISTLKDKTVYGYVKSYADENGLLLNKAEIDRLVMGCVGVKRTTGQHPGGIIIVPKEHSIMEFTPIQYPADKKEGNSPITHFDFHSLDDKLVKLDILGHDDPTALKMLQDITGIDPKSIPLDDQQTLRLFSSDEPLNISLSELECDVGSLGLPEFGTNFVRGILMQTRPKLIEELIRISGLSHGENVWLDNAEPLVRKGVATLSEVFCTRDDIMNYLIARGLDPSMSFKIMENVRKGKGLTDEMEKYVAENSVPEWAIDSFHKIKYMFPRGHAVAYVMMSFRVAYYKVHYPEAFYAVYFTVRADDFDINLACGGTQRVLKNIKSIKNRPKEEGQSDSNKAKMGDQVIILEMVYEMNLRGIELLPIDIEKSDARKFKVEGSAIRPPFSSIPGLGGAAADSIVEARLKGGAFTSIDDFKARCKVNASLVNAMTSLGCFENLKENDQLSLFDMF